jgi:hypothetical protein
MRDTTPHPVSATGTVISVHRTSQGLIQYRRGPDRISVELLGQPTTILAVVRDTDRHHAVRSSREED